MVVAPGARGDTKNSSKINIMQSVLFEKLMLPITLSKHQVYTTFLDPKYAAALALLKAVTDASYLKHPSLKVKKVSVTGRIRWLLLEQLICSA